MVLSYNRYWFLPMLSFSARLTSFVRSIYWSLMDQKFNYTWPIFFPWMKCMYTFEPFKTSIWLGRKWDHWLKILIWAAHCMNLIILSFLIWYHRQWWHNRHWKTINLTRKSMEKVQLYLNFWPQLWVISWLYNHLKKLYINLHRHTGNNYSLRSNGADTSCVNKVTFELWNFYQQNSGSGGLGKKDTFQNSLPKLLLIFYCYVFHLHRSHLHLLQQAWWGKQNQTEAH